MAKIIEQYLIIKLSRVVKDKDNITSLLSQEELLQLQEGIEQTVNDDFDSIIVEFETPSVED